MKVSYKGINQELPPKLQSKLDVKFAKLSKLLEKRGEKEAHVIITRERHLYDAEITVQFYDHQLVGVGSDADLFNAVSAALAKLEVQAVKNRAKWREKKRRKEAPAEKGARSAPRANEPEPREPEESVAQRVYRVNHHQQRKPMTLDEALIEMEKGHDYLAYLDAEKETVSVLVRRRDGHFDLIEV